MLLFHNVYFELSVVIDVLVFAFFFTKSCLPLLTVVAEGPSRSAESGK
jgi:hypothetical protein